MCLKAQKKEEKNKKFTQRRQRGSASWWMKVAFETRSFGIIELRSKSRASRK